MLPQSTSEPANGAGGEDHPVLCNVCLIPPAKFCLLSFLRMTEDYSPCGLLVKVIRAFSLIFGMFSGLKNACNPAWSVAKLIALFIL